MSDTFSFEAEEIEKVEGESRTTGEYLSWLRDKNGGMSIADAVYLRHSVRNYLDKEIEEEKLSVLNKAIEEINKNNSFSFQLVANEPKAFSDSDGADYGKFTCCKNYIALVAPKGCDVSVGYWGEHLVLLAQILGLNTCWVALTYRKRKVPVTVAEGEKFYLVIALGYGANQGVAHVSKDLSELCKVNGEMPDWFERGLVCASLAPTAVNHQQFRFILNEDGTVTPKARVGAYVKVDLGIVKYHFEIGAGDHKVEYSA